MAVGSLYELQTQMEIAKNLQYMDQAAYQTMDDASHEIERMLTSLIRKLVPKP